MFGCILALHSIVSVLSCVTACWFCCSGLTATIINEDFYYYHHVHLYRSYIWFPLSCIKSSLWSSFKDYCSNDCSQLEFSLLFSFWYLPTWWCKINIYTILKMNKCVLLPPTRKLCFPQFVCLLVLFLFTGLYLKVIETFLENL